MVRNWPRPLNPTNIMSFFCQSGYYKSFVDGYSCIASPLKDLTHTKVMFEWLEIRENGFQELKDNLTSALALNLLEGNKGFVVYCGPLQVLLGCVLINMER